MVHPFERCAVQRADAAHGQLHHVGGQRGAVPDGGEELQEAAREGRGDEERAVEGPEAEVAAVFYQLLEERLLGGVGEAGRVGCVCETHFGLLWWWLMVNWMDVVVDPFRLQDSKALRSTRLRGMRVTTEHIDERSVVMCGEDIRSSAEAHAGSRKDGRLIGFEDNMRR